MRDQLDRRLKELKGEFESGQKMLAELEAKETNIRNTLLRISGAIQVLEEELSRESEHPGDAGQPLTVVNESARDL